MDTTLEQAQQAIPAILGTVEESEEGVIFRRGSYQLEWVAYWLLTLDFPVQVIQPVELRQIIEKFATKARQMLDE